nr:MAG TPA: hypothetical protein [Bacteriophage sp.]
MMFAVTEGHLSGTKRVVLCNARNETKRGMQGQPQAAKQGKVTLGQARQAKGYQRHKHPSKHQWGTNMKKTHYN